MADILALTQSPKNVVLSACETGRASGNGLLEGMGIAQAFLTAGSRAVVAPTRVVDDGVARAMSEAMYACLAAKTCADLPEALRAAQSEIRAKRPGADGAAFRVMTR